MTNNILFTKLYPPAHPYVLTFQINSLFLWCFGGCSCPALLLCWLLDIVSNTHLALILLWMILLLGPQPVRAVSQIIMWSWVSFNWFECLLGVNMSILRKSIAPLCCCVPMRHHSCPCQSINSAQLLYGHHVLTGDPFYLWKSTCELSKSLPKCITLWNVYTILPMTSRVLADNCSMLYFVFCQMNFEFLYLDIIKCFIHQFYPLWSGHMCMIPC